VAALVVAAGWGVTGHPARTAVFAALAAVLTALVLAGANLIEQARRLWPAAIPLAIGAAWWISGDHLRGTLFGALSLLTLAFVLMDIDVRKVVGRLVTAVVHVIATVVGTALYVVTVLPAWAISRIRRRDVLRGTRREPTWLSTTADRTPGSLATTTGERRARRSVFGRLSWALGAVVLVLALNYTAGWLWDYAARDASATTASTAMASAVPASTSRAEATYPRDPRNDVPAMAAYPWREQYFIDLQRTPGTYWPFTESRPLSFASRYVNIDDWTRRSYEASDTARPTPTVWFFGGSTTFGEGQRDAYTIPSWVARLAEEAGTPISVRNYGQRGWSHFQEMILYEQQLASNEPPAMSVFYDGANELTSQSLMTERVPTHVTALAYAGQLSGLQIATRARSDGRPPAHQILDDLQDAYVDHSMAHKVARWLGLTTDPAGAAAVQQDPDRGFNIDQESVNGQVSNYRITVQDAKDAIDVYERGRALTLELSRSHGVEPLLFWQPRGYYGPPEAWAIDHLTAPTIDIHDALDDHRDTYIDGGHTNEEGARLVAEVIWDHLRSSVEQWYDDHD